jgi:hypothetical protein
VTSPATANSLLPHDPFTLQQQVQATTKREKTKLLQHVRHASRVRQLLDKQQIELPGRASYTVPSDERQAQATTTKNLIFVVIQK